RGWSGTAPGVLSFDPSGLRWVSVIADQGLDPMAFGWADVFSWRLVGVIPLVGRASGYLWVSLFGGRELVFHVHAVRRWRGALREAMIVGPTHAPPEAVAEPALDDAAVSALVEDAP